MKRLTIVILMAAMSIVALGSAHARTPVRADSADVTAASACLQGPIEQLANTGIQGNSILCMDGAGVHVDMAATSLAPGNAYTVWFVYFDQPSACQSTPCGPPDALGDNPVGTFGRMDGVVADSTGTAGFSGTFRGLHLSSGSAVWLLMFGHGAASTTDNRALARQILTPQRPPLGAPGLGAPADGIVGSGVAQTYLNIP